MIIPYKLGYEAASWKEETVLEGAIRDFSATFTLDDAHTLGENCSIEIQWDNTNFLPTWIEVDSVFCKNPTTEEKLVTCNLTKEITSSLVISFRDTFVKR